MLVTLSGNTGRDVEIKSIPLRDETGSFQLAEIPLAVKVAEDVTDWYKLKFVGDNLVKIASYVTKGMSLCIVGELTFESWTNSKEELCHCAVINVSEIQLPPKSATV